MTAMSMSTLGASEHRAVVDYEFVNGILVIYIPKGVLALTAAEVQIGLKRGKRFKRRTQLEMRLAAQLGANEFHQAPTAVQRIAPGLSNAGAEGNAMKIVSLQAVSHARGSDTVRESVAEHEVSSKAEEHNVTPLVIELPHVQLVINPPSAHLVVEVLANELTTSGRLKDVDDLQLPVARIQVVALEVKGQWLDMRAFQEAGNPRIETARLQVSLDSCPSVLSLDQVETITKALQQTVSHLGQELSAKQVVALWRASNQLLSHFCPELNVRER